MRKSTLIVVIVVTLVAAPLVYLYAITSHHSQEVERIRVVIRRASEAAPAGADPSTWRLVNEGPYMYVTNFMVQRSRCPTAIVTATADQFEARWPQGARSTDDIRAMNELLVTALPKYKDKGGWQETLDEEMKKIDQQLAASRRK